MRKAKKPTAIAAWQAYSLLYFKKRSALHAQVHADFDALKGGDKEVLAKYSHLLSNSDQKSPSSIVWLSFYQAVMKDLVKNATEEEQQAVAEYIETRLDKAIAAHERHGRLTLGVTRTRWQPKKEIISRGESGTRFFVFSKVI